MVSKFWKKQFLSNIVLCKFDMNWQQAEILQHN